MLTSQTRSEAQRAAAAERGWAQASWPALGTTVELVVTQAGAVDEARAVVTGLIEEIDRAASRFRPDSELSRLNAADGQETVLSPLFARSLRVALDAAAWTQGVVDPTVGASVRAAGYDRTFERVDRHGPALLGVWRQAPGWQHITLDETAGTVRVPQGVVLDLGATAKALACDLAVEAVVEAVGGGALLSIGGDVSVAGHAPEQGWPVGCAHIADPSQPTSAGDQIVMLGDGGLATSGVRARRWQRGGSWLHHIIDPRTGAPSVTPWVTASVLAPTCVLANSASTAAIILGHEAPKWLAAQGLPYRLVDVEGRVRHGNGWPGKDPQ
jgi:FAD:protein FMN transferase